MTHKRLIIIIFNEEISLKACRDLKLLIKFTYHFQKSSIINNVHGDQTKCRQMFIEI